jgi:hypothetical protein
VGLGCVETAWDRSLVGYGRALVVLAADFPTSLPIGAVDGVGSDLRRLWGGICADLDASPPHQTRIAAINGLMPMMFMTRVRL